MLERTGRHEERVELYRAALDHRFEPAERLATLHTIADALRETSSAVPTRRSRPTAPRSTSTTTTIGRSTRSRSSTASASAGTTWPSSTCGAPSGGHRGRGGRVTGWRWRGSTAQRARQHRARDRSARGDRPRRPRHHAEAIARARRRCASEPEHKERVVEILRPALRGARRLAPLIKLNEDRYALARRHRREGRASCARRRGSGKSAAATSSAPAGAGVAFELDPDDAEVRGELERLAEATEAWDELAETYEEALADQPDVASRREILAVLAASTTSSATTRGARSTRTSASRRRRERARAARTRWSSSPRCSATGRRSCAC